jgi:ribosomal protein L3 glutamine methyltransferase
MVEDALVSAGVFVGHGTDNAMDEAWQLVLSAAGMKLDAEDSVLQQELDDQQLVRIQSLLEKRITLRLPLPYLTGEAWFAGMPFQVSQDVLIPRSPIAELIEAGFQPWCIDSPASILDLCCGCGCIGAAVANVFPEARVDLCDISPCAVEISGANIQRLGLSDRANILQSDLFAGLEPRQYDLIVSNPPYVDQQDMANMPPEFNHEPTLALAAGKDGLDIVRRILSEALAWLSPDGLLIVEVGNSWPALEEAYPRVPFLWLEFERGGHGVFLLERAQLEEFQADFNV